MSAAEREGQDLEREPRPLLRGVAVHKNYGGVHAVRGVNFTVAANSYVTLLGPSGCGKTSLLRMIGGFEEISSGVIQLDDRSLSTIPPSKRPVNTVFQNYALFPHLTVEENVGSALAMVRMTLMAKRRPRQLSGGRQQRVALSRAIVNEPRLLLLDEPLSALDRRMRKDMQIELKDIQRRLNMTFLHVTHDQEEAFALSDEIIVMNNGRVEQQSAPTEIYRRPSSAYVADFIGGANLVPGQIRAVSHGRATIETRLGAFESPCAAGLIQGASAVLCLRPEQMRLSSADGFEATVTHVVFRGAEWLVELQIAGGARLNLLVREQKPPGIGEAIRFSFDVSRAWVATADERGV